MSTAQPSTTTPAYPDRSTRLMIFGIFQILLGCLCGLMAAMLVGVTLLGPMAKAPQGEAISMQMMIPGMIFYLLLAVTLIWLGIGSIRARRWAWTLTVVLSWMWLIMGVVAFAGLVFLAGPMMSASIAEQSKGKASPEMIMAIRIVSGAVTFCIYILLPAMFLLFYHHASVRATCQRRDPKVRWTDRCPMPVLALSLLMASSVVSMLLMPIYGCVMPLFGCLISGMTGAVVVLVIALVLAYLAWGTYRLKMAAWWGMLLFLIVGTLNTVATFSQTDLMEMYERMGMPAAQLEMMRKSGFVETMSCWGPWLVLVAGGAWLGYLLYVRRYFVRNGEETTSTS